MLFRKTARALMVEIGDLPYASTKVRFMVICAKDYAVKLSSLGICSSVMAALLLRCCAVQEACCWNIPLWGGLKKLLGGIWCCPTPKKASVEDIFARNGGLYAIYLHKDFVAVQINCTFAADFTN